MFYHCKAFNKDLNSRDVSNVKNMLLMFTYCTNFNRNLNNWDITKVEIMNGMFSGCTLWNNGGQELNKEWQEKIKELNIKSNTKKIFTNTLFIEDGEPGENYDENGLLE